MKITPEAVRLARMAKVSPLCLQSALDGIDEWIQEMKRIAELKQVANPPIIIHFDGLLSDGKARDHEG